MPEPEDREVRGYIRRQPERSRGCAQIPAQRQKQYESPYQNRNFRRSGQSRTAQSRQPLSIRSSDCDTDAGETRARRGRGGKRLRDDENVRTAPYDLVFMDCPMPEMDG